MPSYNCKRCMKSFNDKSKFRNHLLRKTLCKIGEGGENMQYIDIWKIYFPKIDFNEIKKKKGCKKRSVYICDNCGKIIKHSSSYYRHINKTCSINAKLSDMKKEIKEQNNLISKLIDMKDKSNVTNIFNQNNINITLNNFGEEDLSHISDKFVNSIITHMNNMAIVRYIQEVHFKNPSNKNIKMIDEETKYMMIRKNNQWILGNKNNVIDGMINININRIQKACKDEGKNFFYDYSNNKIDDIKDNTENMILSNQMKYISM